MKESVVPDAIELLKIRRSVKPREMSAPGPSPAELETILTIGARVPDHGKLTPWRFIVFEGDARVRAGEVIANVFARKNPSAPAADVDVEKRRLTDAPLVIGVVSFTRPHPKVPPWEQELSAGASAMNIVTAATALGYGACWLTGWVESAAKAGDRPHDRNDIGALRKILHKRAIDLDLVERKTSEIAEAGISGAEIVHRNADAEFTQLMQDRKIGLGLRQEERFGNFQLEPQWRQSGLRQCPDHHLNQVAAAKLHRRQIDGDLDIRGPSHRLPTGFPQHPLPIRDDQYAVF